MSDNLRQNSVKIILNTVMVLTCLIMLYPFIYSLSYSLSDSTKAMVTNITLLPVGFTFENYIYVLSSKIIYKSFIISVLRTVLGIVWAVSITGLAAYAISKRGMPGKKMISLFLIIPMYITGGLLPTYILMSKLHLFNNFLVFILPHGFWGFNMLLMKTYFDTLPPSLEESAKLDGASEFKIFIRIIVPLAMPIMAVVAMYTGVWHWNSWFDAVLYITKEDLRPLQTILQRLIMESYASSMEAASGRVSERTVSSEAIKMSTLMVSTMPIVFIYPFFQKYFIKGIMIGAVKA